MIKNKLIHYSINQSSDCANLSKKSIIQSYQVINNKIKSVSINMYVFYIILTQKHINYPY